MTLPTPRAFSPSLRGQIARRRRAQAATPSDPVATPPSAIVFPAGRIERRNGAFIYVEDDGNALRLVLRRLGNCL